MRCVSTDPTLLTSRRTANTLALLVAVLSGCSELADPLAPGALAPPQAAQDASRPSHDGALATIQWNELTRALVAQYRTDPAARSYAAVSLAQFAAATYNKEVQHGTGAATRAAIAGASAAVLAYLYPSEAQALEARVRAQQAAEDARFARGVEAGGTAGRALAQPVIDWLRTDGSEAVWTGAVPAGPGLWVPRGAPVTPLLGQVRPFFLSSGSELRPPAPPAFGSQEFRDALAEVRHISDTRTAAQVQLAQFWSLSGGTIRMPGYWNQAAVGLIVDGGLAERKAAAVFSLLNTAMMDATIACFDAKYVYWLIRPSQADPAITVATSLSNHPSYPSSHSCTSGAGAEVLATLFPADAERLRAAEIEIGESRIIGGLHYRFDITVGNALGESAARIALGAGEQGLRGIVR